MRQVKKFDPTIERQCKLCKEMFLPSVPLWKCPKCQAAYQRMKNKESYIIKDAYPFIEPEKSSRFRRIKRELGKCKTQKERSEHFGKQLEEIIDNGIMKWIWDRRDMESKQKAKVKSVNAQHKDYPSTKGLYFD
jgi:hypothetical protein